jgi:hypothetical protein
MFSPTYLIKVNYLTKVSAAGAAVAVAAAGAAAVAAAGAAAVAAFPAA